jgi:hypothetical protein
MKRASLYVMGLMLLGMIGFGDSTAMAVTAAAGPYYATPSWDQTMPVSTRFIVLTNMSSAAVLDRETGLVWEQSPSTSTFTWADAQVQCMDLTKGGRDGWRLPTIQDLKSLIDRTQSPTLPSGHPFSNVQPANYWSATTTATVAGSAWFLNFFNGGSFAESMINDLYVWCVRGGHGVDSQ